MCLQKKCKICKEAAYDQWAENADTRHKRRISTKTISHQAAGKEIKGVIFQACQ